MPIAQPAPEMGDKIIAGENKIPPEAKPEPTKPEKPEEEEYKIVEAPPDESTKETLRAVRDYGGEQFRKEMGRFYKPGHRTHVPAKGQPRGPRRTRKI